MNSIDLNVILENMPVAYAFHEMIYDDGGNPVDYRFVKVNSYFEKITGTIAREIEGKTCMEVFPATEKYWIDYFEECIRSKTTNQYENFSAALNGYFQVTVFSDSSGRFVTMTTDVTSQVEKRMELIRNEQRYRLSQEVGKTGSWVYSIKDDKYWNSEEFRKIFGIATHEENVNRAVESCIIDNDYVKTALTNLIENGITYDIEFEIFRNNDKQRRTINSKARVEYDSANVPVNVYGYLTDITDQKRFETRIKESEAVLKAILQHTQFSIWSIGAEREIIYMNDVFRHNFQRIFGKTPKVGLRLIDLVPDDQKSHWSEKYRQVLAGQAFCEESSFIVDGETEFVEISATPISLEGKIVGATFYAKDITEVKTFVDRIEKSEAIASESLLKFEKIFTYNPAIMMLIDIDTHRYSDVNNSFIKNLEYSREEVLGKTPVELGVILAEDIETFRYVGRAIYQKKSVEDFIIRLKKKSGKVMTGFFSSQVIETNGKEFGLGVFLDITERKYYEDLLRSNALNLKKILEFSRVFIEPFADEPECKSILNMVRVLSGANHVFFNMLTNKFSNVKCMSSESITSVELDNIFGVDLLKHKWERTPETDQLWINSKSTRFSSLNFLKTFGVDEEIVDRLSRVYNIDFAVLIRIEGIQKVEGNFLLFFERGNEFLNSDIVEIFSYQVGQYIERFYAEMVLKDKMNEMERFYKLSVNRELNMVELKKEINALLCELGREPKYNIVSRN